MKDALPLTTFGSSFRIYPSSFSLAEVFPDRNEPGFSDEIRSRGVDMAKRKAARGKKIAGRKKAAKAGGRKCTATRTAQPKKRKRLAGRNTQPRKQKRPAKKTVQPRVWRRMARLADDALGALDVGNVREVRQYLQSIRAVAECADELGT
jgi:hypothetical protein